MESKELQDRIEEIEAAMLATDFWSDKITAQALIKELGELKDSLAGVGKHDKGSAIMAILSGAGGDDAEDFTRMLLAMYMKYAEGKGLVVSIMHENKNDHGGYRNITLEIAGKGAYGLLQHENGVHRLVRLSPFNANQKRHTSFSMVEVLPVLDSLPELVIDPKDLRIELSKSGGPGGQNVNKRETAVRIVHIPSGITAAADGQRTQEANKEKAMQMLRGKIYAALEVARKQDKESMQISKTMEIEWGNQIRSYVLHPYKMVKDHRSNFEVRDVERVLERGEIDALIESVKNLTVL
ncbi:MAG: peptide chain release factor 2 [Planctomycetota bacterium]|jgi:peptide chain release factor 2